MGEACEAEQAPQRRRAFRSLSPFSGFRLTSFPQQLTSATQQDMVTGPTSTTAQTRFVNRVPPSQQPHPHESRHPYSKGIPASPSHKDHPRNISPMAEPRPGSSKAKIVLFTTPTYYAHSASGMTDEEYDGEEGGEVEYEEEGMEVDEHEQHEQGGGFEEDEDEEEDEEIDAGHQAGGEESEFSDEEDREGEAALAGGNLHDEMSSTGHGGGVEDEAAKREHWERETAAAMQAQQQAAEAEAQWARDREEQQQQQQRDLEQQQQQQRSLSPSHSITSATGRGALSPQNLNAQQPDLSSSVPPPSGKRSPSSRFVEDTNTTNTSSAPYSPTTTRQLRSPTSGGSLNGRSTFDENAFASAPTKKLTATPPIARGSEGRFDDPEDLAGRFDAFAADAEAEAAPYDLSPQRQQQKQLYASPQQQQQQQLRDDLSASTLSPTSSAQGLGLVQKVRGIDLVDPRDPRYHRMLQPTKQAGEEGVYERIVMQQRQEQQQQSVAMVNKRSFSEDGTAGVGETSIGSIETGDSRGSDGGSLSSSTGRRASQTTGGGAGGAGAKDDGSKKRKSGGGILGLFRKKDKKKKGGAAGGEKQTEDEPRSSEDSGRLVSPTATGSSLSGSIGGAGGRSPRSSADRGPSSGGALSSSKRDSTQATAESMFSTDAALRQQELEAKQALYQQYGVQRNPGDLSNTMTPRVVSNGSSIDVQLSQQQYQQQQQQQRSNNRNSLQLLNHPSSLVGPHGSPGSMSGSLAPLQRQRPGSLMGTPSIAGIEVPLLSVMRVFAGEHVDSEATFKTVLLNQSTTSTDLVKQAMQRFRLVEAELTTEDFFLTVKEIGGEERALEDDEKPLGVFEELSERAGDDVLPPNVRRSSIGSINSISSALSINPAITRLGMNDWSDDSAVKFYLNRRGMDPSSPAFDPAQQYQGEEEHTLTPTLQQGEYSDNGSNYTATPTLDHGAAQFGSTSSPGQSPIAHPSATLHPAPALLSSSSSASSSGPAPSYRFAIRLLIHPSDLPDTVVFDPHSTAIIPKAVLLERQQRSGGFSDASGDVSPNAREKIIFFPRNANVSEVVEAALDRFGIVDGVVDGGDEVEDRVSRRRSVTRVKYSLAAEKDGRGASSIPLLPFLFLLEEAVSDHVDGLQNSFSTPRASSSKPSRLPPSSKPTTATRKSSVVAPSTPPSSSARLKTFNLPTPFSSSAVRPSAPPQESPLAVLSLRRSTSSRNGSSSDERTSRRFSPARPTRTPTRTRLPSRIRRAARSGISSRRNERLNGRTSARSSRRRGTRTRASTSRFPSRGRFGALGVEKATPFGTRSSTTTERRSTSARLLRTSGRARALPPPPSPQTTLSTSPTCLLRRPALRLGSNAPPLPPPTRPTTPSRSGQLGRCRRGQRTRTKTSKKRSTPSERPTSTSGSASGRSRPRLPPPSLLRRPSPTLPSAPTCFKAHLVLDPSPPPSLTSLSKSVSIASSPASRRRRLVAPPVRQAVVLGRTSRVRVVALHQAAVFLPPWCSPVSGTATDARLPLRTAPRRR